LSTLEAMGFDFATIDGVLKVSHGNCIILKGNRLNNLYYLQCSTVDVEAVSIAFQKRVILMIRSRAPVPSLMIPYTWLIFKFSILVVFG
jgi:hypothetical protein